MSGASASTEQSQVSNQVMVGRQAIFDRDLQVMGYELLYRDSQMNAATFSDGDAVDGSGDAQYVFRNRAGSNGGAASGLY